MVYQGRQGQEPKVYRKALDEYVVDIFSFSDCGKGLIVDLSQQIVSQTQVKC